VGLEEDAVSTARVRLGGSAAPVFADLGDFGEYR
jgi:hypothetical protein